VGGGSAAVVALQKATATIPIVMIVVVDPVADGLVRSLARPGGNITGFTTLAVDLGPKRLEMLHAMVPNLSRVAVLYAPVNESTQNTPQSIVAAAQKLGIKILPVAARTPEEIDKAFALMRKQDAGAVMVLLNPFFQQQKDQIAALAMKHRLPAMTADQMYAQAGCLMSYGSSFVYAFQRVATYVDKILKGARPAELPVEQPTTFELVINGKTAKTLGLKIPNSILVQATKVIE
jgi:putative ABC transport system substrate-binding protein